MIMTHGLLKALGSLISPHCKPKTENRKKKEAEGSSVFPRKEDGGSDPQEENEL